MNLIENLQDFVLSLPEAIQFLGVMLAAMVPFVENYGAVVIGSVAGVPIWVTVILAVLGNIAIIVVITLIASRTRSAVINRSSRPAQEGPSPRQQRIQRLFDRYGVPGVTLLGMLLVPTHFIAPTLVSFGSPRAVVILWHAIAITVYGVITGLLLAGMFSIMGV